MNSLIISLGWVPGVPAGWDSAHRSAWKRLGAAERTRPAGAERAVRGGSSAGHAAAVRTSKSLAETQPDQHLLDQVHDGTTGTSAVKLAVVIVIGRSQLGTCTLELVRAGWTRQKMPYHAMRCAALSRIAMMPCQRARIYRGVYRRRPGRSRPVQTCDKDPGSSSRARPHPAIRQASM
jgi:hypothetical protein